MCVRLDVAFKQSQVPSLVTSSERTSHTSVPRKEAALDNLRDIPQDNIMALNREKGARVLRTGLYGIEL